MVFTLPAYGLRLFSLRLRSDRKLLGSKCSMHLNLDLNFWLDVGLPDGQYFTDLVGIYFTAN